MTPRRRIAAALCLSISVTLAARVQEVPADVTALPGRQVALAIAELPPQANFNLSGLRYFKGKLYATSSVGLIELEGPTPSRLFRSRSRYFVVSGPWIDPVNGWLWIRDANMFGMMRYDGTEWRQSPMPPPEKGRYTRGDVQADMPLVPHDNTVWMIAGGTIWRFFSASPARWQSFPRPNQSAGDDATPLGVLSLGGTPGLIVRHEDMAFLIKEGDDYRSDTFMRFISDWEPIPLPKDYKFFTETFTSAGGNGYVCTRTGDVLEITTTAVRKLQAPARCETVATSTEGRLLASFQKTGLYEFRETWIQRSPHPYAGGGDYWTYLAGQADELAIAVVPRPVVDRSATLGRSDPDIRFTTNATAGFWHIRGREITAIKLR